MKKMWYTFIFIIILALLVFAGCKMFSNGGSDESEPDEGTVSESVEATSENVSEEVSSQDAVYEMRPPMDEEAIQKLNEQLRRLRETVRLHPEAEAVFFRVCDDPHHAACGKLGNRETVCGFVQEVSIPHQYLRISGQVIAFADLLEIRIKDR